MSTLLRVRKGISTTTSGKYFSRIRLLWVDLIHRSRRSHVPSPGATLIHIDQLRVIDFFQINLSDWCNLISIDQLNSPRVILYCSFQSTYASAYDGSLGNFIFNFKIITINILKYDLSLQFFMRPILVYSLKI